MLEGREFISPRSHLTLVRSMLLLDDLTKAEKFKETPSSKAEKFYLLTQSHNILIEQVRVLLCPQDLETYFSVFSYSVPHELITHSSASFTDANFWRNN